MCHWTSPHWVDGICRKHELAGLPCPECLATRDPDLEVQRCKIALSGLSTPEDDDVCRAALEGSLGPKPPLPALPAEAATESALAESPALKCSKCGSTTLVLYVDRTLPEVWAQGEDGTWVLADEPEEDEGLESNVLTCAACFAQDTASRAKEAGRHLRAYLKTCAPPEPDPIGSDVAMRRFILSFRGDKADPLVNKYPAAANALIEATRPYDVDLQDCLTQVAHTIRRVKDDQALDLLAALMKDTFLIGWIARSEVGSRPV